RIVLQGDLFQVAQAERRRGMRPRLGQCGGRVITPEGVTCPPGGDDEAGQTGRPVPGVGAHPCSSWSEARARNRLRPTAVSAVRVSSVLSICPTFPKKPSVRGMVGAVLWNWRTG